MLSTVFRSALPRGGAVRIVKLLDRLGLALAVAQGVKQRWLSAPATDLTHAGPPLYRMIDGGIHHGGIVERLYMTAGLGLDRRTHPPRLRE